MLALALALSLLSGQYGPLGIKSFVLPEPLTRSAPTLSTEGVDLKGLVAVRITVCATPPDTLSGTGTLKLYVHSPGGWAPLRSRTLALGAAGAPCETWDEIPIQVGVGRLLAAPTAVGVSGSTTIVPVRYEASTR